MDWTTPDEVRRQLHRRWLSGVYLTMVAENRPWEPLAVPLRGPKSGELAGRFEEVREWVAHWDRVDQKVLRVERKTMGSRTIGANHIPARVWIDGYDQLWAVLRARDQVRRFRELYTSTVARSPRLADWMRAYPMKVLELQDRWPELHATVLWIDEHARPGTFLRQIDAPGVDTKFIEQHKAVLAALLDRQLSASRIDTAMPRTDFTGRFGFQKKPEYVRFRMLDDGSLAGFTELTVRAAEFTTHPVGVTKVFVIENEITYLAFPAVPDAVAIFGGGYAVGTLESLTWLAETELTYWGDIDTHGFAILNRLRTRFPGARSMLMDRRTLLDHECHWVREPGPINARLDHLSAEESELYADLVGHAIGPSVRLEQERIRFSAIKRFLAEPEAHRD